MREAITFKALFGTLTEKNKPTATDGVLPFPIDANKRPLTQPLGAQPYLEISAGIGNIFKFMRVDYIWRLTYKDLPNVQKYGIKLQMKLKKFRDKKTLGGALFNEKQLLENAFER